MAGPWVTMDALRKLLCELAVGYNKKSTGVSTHVTWPQNFDVMRADVRNGLNCFHDALHWVPVKFDVDVNI